MKLNSAQLEAFFTVSQQQNFTKAAEILHVTQSALSQRIAKLEEELEATLFIRDRTSIRLTIFGEKLLRFCQLNRSAEEEFLLNLKDTKNDLRGMIRIGGFSSVNNSLLVPSLKGLMGNNQALSIQVITKELYELETLLSSSQVDYILTNKKSNSQHIESLFLGFEENILVESKHHKSVEIYLDHDENDPTTKDYFNKFKQKFNPKMMRYLDDVQGMIAGVKNGYGKAILPKHLIKDEKDLEVVNPKYILSVPVFLQYYTQPYYRKIHSILIREIEKYFKSNLKQ